MVFLFCAPLSATPEKESQRKALPELEQVRTHLKQLFSGSQRDSRKAWQKLLQRGESILPLLEALKGELLPHQVKVVTRLMLEIEFQSAAKTWPKSFSPLQHPLWKAVKKAQDVETALQLVGTFEEQMRHWLKSLAIRPRRKLYLHQLHRQGIWLTLPLWRERINPIQSLETEYLWQRLWQSSLPRWRREVLQVPAQQIPWQLSRLLAPLVRWMYLHGSSKEKQWCQRFLDSHLPKLVNLLDHPKDKVRHFVSSSLWQFRPLSRVHLEKVLAAKGSLEKQRRIKLLLYQMNWEVSPELLERIGLLLEGFSNLAPRQKRKKLFWLTRLGGLSAIGALWQVLRREKHPMVQSYAAQQLILLGDSRVLAYLSRHNLREALDNLQSLAEYYMSQGIQALEKQDFDEAVKFFRKVLKIQPRNATAYYNLACAYSLWNKVDLALNYLEKAIRLGFRDVKHMKADSDLDNVRQHPRFRELCELAEKLKKRAHSD